MSFAKDGSDTERLVELVREALQRLEAGQAIDPSALCADCPHLAAPLAEVLGLREQLPLLQHAALRDDPLAGAVLGGRYALRGCLGRGAMGVVYVGEDRELQRAVAVKILDVRLFRSDDAEVRFQREAEALAALQHRHVVAVFDRGRTPEGIHYLVMELLQGGTLAQLLERIARGDAPVAAVTELLAEAPAEPHWPRLLASYAAQLADGLHAAHQRGLVHRDVKPSNVFLATGGRPVLLDFGIAARGSDDRLTATRATLGTPWYMAPEQLHGAAIASPALDVYGLGATLFHLLAGRPPHEGEAAAVLSQLAHRDPPPLASVARAVPRDLAAIVDRCLERQPRRRYATAAALADDLHAFLRHEPVAARPLSPWLRQWRRIVRSPTRALLIACGVLLLTIAGVLTMSWQAERRAQRGALKQQLLATLPSLLVVEGWPEERVLAELDAEHRDSLGLLDRLLELDPADLSLRLLRGCLRQDLGDAAGAAADLGFVATVADGPYLRALANRYATAAVGARGVRAIDLDGLPEPQSPAECYVAGVHELRASDRPQFAARADALLVRAGADYLPARDQRLLSLAARAERARGAEQRSLLKTLYDETIALEVLYGRPTARTTALRGVSLLLKQDYVAAIPEFERSLQLRPARHGPLHNLGLCQLRIHQLEPAERHLLAALQVRPFAWNTRFTLAQLERTRGNFDRARQLATELPASGQRNEAWRRLDLLGSIELAAALALRREAPDRSREAATRAIAAYDEALALRGDAEAAQRRALALAMLEARPQDELTRFAATMLADPDNPYQLANLAFLMSPRGLDAAESAWVSAVLRRLAQQLAPGDTMLQQRMDAEVAEVLAPHLPKK